MHMYIQICINHYNCNRRGPDPSRVGEATFHYKMVRIETTFPKMIKQMSTCIRTNANLKFICFIDISKGTIPLPCH